MNVRQLATRVDAGQGLATRGSPHAAPAQPAHRTAFADTLRRAREEASAEDVKLSAHAAVRIAQRSIPLDATQRREMAAALQQLEAKGARDALLMRADAAFVVNVPSRTVVTAIDQQELKDRIFTQIDSAMLL